MKFFTGLLLCLILMFFAPGKAHAASAHPWLGLSGGLVAHAGGRFGGYVGTNTREAVLANYRLGHRVFELDLNLTTDGHLVCVHDWPSYSGPLSLEAFRQRRIVGRFKPATLNDIFTLMLKYTDMYMVTDTKSFEYTDEEASLQFRLLYEGAAERDIRLLDRIVPQIYNQRHYALLTEVYPFKSIIYTLYASPDSDEEVTAFVKDKADIAVITMGPVRYSEAFYKALTGCGKKIYFFTLNDMKEIGKAKALGIHGFYTDYINPRQMRRFTPSNTEKNVQPV